MSDIVQECRAMNYRAASDRARIGREAAAEIDRLRAEVERLTRENDERNLGALAIIRHGNIEIATLRAEVERQTHALTVAKAALADDASKAIKLTASSLISHVLEHSAALAQEKQG